MGVSLPDYIDQNNVTQLAWYYKDNAIPQRFNAGIVVASVIVSVLGSYTTLVLLSRRTANAGRMNLAYLLLAATCCASVAIWGMHYLGMPSRLEASPTQAWFIHFHPGFTVLSLFAPLLALMAAFWWLGSQSQFSGWRVGVAGVSTGCIIALMHFSASFNASFKVEYNPIHTTFSIIIACVAATAAFFIFFKWRSQWQDVWWKRLCSAFVLTAAICGMHYLAVWGTSYYVDHPDSIRPDLGKHESTTLTIAIAAMCGALCLMAAAFAFVDAIALRNTRRRARQVVVASASFDKSGRLLVTADGTIPMKTIHTDVALKDLLHELDHRQPTFQWLYALSWNWDIITPFINALSARVLKDPATPTPSPAARLSAAHRVGLSSRYDRSSEMANFRERFVEAAQSLAAELEVNIEHIGVLFDKVLPTGTRRLPEAKPEPFSVREVKSDDESSIHGIIVSTPGKEGVMLFLVREIDDAERWTSRGYRLAETRFLVPVLADRVATERAEMEALLNQLKIFAKRGTRPVVQPGGFYVGLFGVRPSHSRQGGVDTLVYNFSRHQIPAFRLPDVRTITDGVRAWIAANMNKTMLEVITACELDSSRMQALEHGHQDRDEDLIFFLLSFYVALDALITAMRIYPNMSRVARISPEILDVPSSLDDSTEPAQMMIFEAVLPPAQRPCDMSEEEKQITPAEHGATISESAKSQSPFVYTPYSLFSKAQMMLLRGKASKDFARDVRLELAKWYKVEATLMSALSGNSPITPQLPLHAVASPMSSPGDESTLVSLAGSPSKKFHVALTSSSSVTDSLNKALIGGHPIVRTRSETTDSRDGHDGDFKELPRPPSAAGSAGSENDEGNMGTVRSMGIRRYLGGGGGESMHRTSTAGTIPPIAVSISPASNDHSTMHDNGMSLAASGAITSSAHRPTAAWGTHPPAPPAQTVITFAVPETPPRTSSVGRVTARAAARQALASPPATGDEDTDSLGLAKGPVRPAPVRQQRSFQMSTPARPRTATSPASMPMVPQQSLQRPSTAGGTPTVVRRPADGASRPGFLPLAAAARIGADSWYNRCMSDLEHGPQGDELLGVEY